MYDNRNGRILNPVTETNSNDFTNDKYSMRKLILTLGIFQT